MPYESSIASATLTGSLLSAVSTFCVLVCYAVFHREQRSFRHALVFNLALSDFINSTNNSISGAIYMRDHMLQPGAACVVNGFVGQLSVQATDFSILSISLATLLVVTRKGRIAGAVDSLRFRALLCASVWIVPLTTSLTALSLGALEPVSGNWCWISQRRTDLRYGLTHGWRFAIILITVIIYTYIWIHLSRHFRALGAFSSSSGTGSSSHGRKGTNLEMGPFSRLGGRDEEQSNESRSNLVVISPMSPVQVPAKTSSYSLKPPTIDSHPQKSKATQAKQKQLERHIKRMMLLNGYPILYVILWIPGITNRIMEASGNASPSRVLAILQCSTQFIGFANSVTYGLNQHWKAGR